MSIRTRASQKRLPRSFSDLSALHPLRPIQDEVDFKNAQEVADRLAVLDHRTKAQDDYLETLSTLMEKYEDEHAEIETDDLDPLQMLTYLVKAHDMSASDLGRILGNRALGGSILRGDRELSKTHIVTLSKHFGVNPSVFLKV